MPFTTLAAPWPTNSKPVQLAGAAETIMPSPVSHAPTTPHARTPAPTWLLSGPANRPQPLQLRFIQCKLPRAHQLDGVGTRDQRKKLSQGVAMAWPEPYEERLWTQNRHAFTTVNTCC